MKKKIKVSKTQKPANCGYTVLATVPFDELLEPFNPYIKRFGFMYVHFKNGGCLMSNELNSLIKDLWNGNQNEYNTKVSEWCVEHCC